MNAIKYFEDLYSKSNSKLAKSIISTTAKVVKAVDAKSPIILLAAGVIGVAGGTYLLIKSGDNEEIDAEIEECNEVIDDLHAQKESITENDTVAMNAYRKELAETYAKKGLCYVRKYGKALTIEVVSLYSIIQSYRILNGRAKRTYLAYTSIAAAYDDYRKKIIAAIGKEAEERIRFGIHTEEVLNPVLDKEGNPKLDKDGNPKMKKSTIDVVDEPIDILDDVNSFLFAPVSSGIFDTSIDPITQWEANMTTLSIIRNAANQLMTDRINMYGIKNAYVTVNEVLEKFAPRRLPTLGNVITWNPNSPDYTGIDFGISDFSDPKMKERRMAFLRGEEEAILLTFNHTGTDSRLHA